MFFSQIPEYDSYDTLFSSDYSVFLSSLYSLLNPRLAARVLEPDDPENLPNAS